MPSSNDGEPPPSTATNVIVCSAGQHTTGFRRAELFRRLNRAGAPNSWGLRLFNGHGEQQVTIFFPNPFLSYDGEKVRKQPDWSRLAPWDEMRARYAGAPEPDPFDRSSTGFRHD
jgi:hypothetical protein